MLSRARHKQSQEDGIAYRLGAAFGRNQINELDVLWHGLPTVPRWRITIHPELVTKVGRSGDRPIT